MLPLLVQALLDPKAYPHSPRHIELAQTQISFVFLADEYVYKVKKPVDFGFLDFTTLEKRRFFCGQEVELNSRLCPDVYLGVVPITQGKGGISVGGEGEVIEYAVKMRQLPRERMMDQLLQRDLVSPEMVERVARRLAEFHEGAETNEEIASYGDPGAALKNAEENFTQTEKYIGVTISRDSYQRIRDYTYSFLEEKAALFEARRREGRIRDCHGDVHAAHVCFSNGICIFDCIEFNERFRYSDVANEVAFLAMDLDYHGRRDLSRRFVAAYVEASRDRGLLELLDFYKGYRAYVRGKVEGFKLDDPHISEVEKAMVLDIARRYFGLADLYASKS